MIILQLQTYFLLKTLSFYIKYITLEVLFNSVSVHGHGPTPHVQFAF